jgi:hypothetical protein
MKKIAFRLITAIVLVLFYFFGLVTAYTFDFGSEHERNWLAEPVKHYVWINILDAICWILYATRLI